METLRIKPLNHQEGCLIVGDSEFCNAGSIAVKDGNKRIKVFKSESGSIGEFTSKYRNYPPKTIVVQSGLKILEALAGKLSTELASRTQKVFLYNKEARIPAVFNVPNMTVVRSFQELSHAIAQDNKEKIDKLPPSEVLRYEKGETIIYTGSNHEYVYIIASGEVSVDFIPPKGVSIEVGVFNLGTIFGHTHHLNGGTPSFNFTAKSDVVTVKKVHYLKAFEMFSKSPKLAEAALKSSSLEHSCLDFVVSKFFLREI